MMPAYSDPDSEFIRFPHIERPFPSQSDTPRHSRKRSGRRRRWARGSRARGILAAIDDPLTRLKSHHSDIAAFLSGGMDRMTNFSTSTTRKKMMLPQTSQSHAASGKPSVLKISWNGGA